MITRREALVSCAAAGAAATVAGLPLSPVAWAQGARSTIISNPVLGFVNLLGTAGNELMEKDRAVLADVFQNNIKVAGDDVPLCNVLFFYGNLEPSTRIAGQKFTFRDMVKAAQAHVAVMASELPDAVISSQEFRDALNAPSDWRANIVITLERRGDYFGRFFQRLFTLMRTGLTLPVAWVKLAPQGPTQPRDLPSSVVLLEANVAFGPKKS